MKTELVGVNFIIEAHYPYSTVFWYTTLCACQILYNTKLKGTLWLKLIRLTNYTWKASLCQSFFCIELQAHTGNTAVELNYIYSVNLALVSHFLPYFSLLKACYPQLFSISIHTTKAECLILIYHYFIHDTNWYYTGVVL